MGPRPGRVDRVGEVLGDRVRALCLAMSVWMVDAAFRRVQQQRIRTARLIAVRIVVMAGNSLANEVVGDSWTIG